MGFKVTLNLENDAELRAYIKDLIKEGVDAAMKNKDWEKMVDEAAQNLLKSLLKV